MKYRDFSPVQLFKLFFDEDLWNLLVIQTMVYATFRGETNFLVTKIKNESVYRNFDSI